MDFIYSVVIPTYNRREFLREALDSVAAQTLKPHEVIVVDDGCTDGTREMLSQWQQLPLKVIPGPHRGHSQARNLGIEAVSTEWIAFLDDDDLWKPEKARRQASLILAQPNMDLVFCRCLTFGTPQLKTHHEPFGGLTASGLICRRSVFEKVGAFDHGITMGEFVDWVSRARDAGFRDSVCPEVGFLRRVHPGNTVQRQRHLRSEYARVVHQHMLRKRAASRAD